MKFSFARKTEVQIKAMLRYRFYIEISFLYPVDGLVCVCLTISSLGTDIDQWELIF